MKEEATGRIRWRTGGGGSEGGGGGEAIPKAVTSGIARPLESKVLLGGIEGPFLR